MLTALKVKNATAKQKLYRLYDSHGLYLQVNPSGGKYWRYKYYVGAGTQRKEKTLSIGVYPEVTLMQAREAHLIARDLHNQGKDPSFEKQKKLRAANISKINTFGTLAEQWFQTKSHSWSGVHIVRQQRLLFVDLADLHNTPITDLKGPEIRLCLQKMIDRQVYESAIRALYIVGQIFNQAIALDKVEYNPAPALKPTLPKPNVKHYSAATDTTSLRSVIARIWNHPGRPLTKYALRLLPLLLVRTGELRKMEWCEIQNDATWKIPGSKINKTKRDHIIPLPSQAVKILDHIREQPGSQHSKYVFPNTRSLTEPMSNNTMRQAFRDAGISKDEATPHGFRASARTILAEEFDYPIEWIEHQLAHTVKDPNGTAYNRTHFLKPRRKMLQAWADHIFKDIEDQH